MVQLVIVLLMVLLLSAGQAHLVQISIDEDAIPHIKGVDHEEEDHAVKHGCNGALEDEAEGHDCCCHRRPEVCHVHLYNAVDQGSTMQCHTVHN